VRRAVALATALLALAIAPRPALPCGGGGGDSSGGGSSGGSSGGGGDSSSSSESEPACVETSSVVGRSTCSYSRYGRWNVAWVPRLSMLFGTSFHRFSLDGMSWSGTAPHGEGIAYAMVGGDVSSDLASAMTVDMNLTGRLGRYLYLGAEGKLGRAMVDAGQRVDGALTMQASGSLYSELGGVAGISVPLGGWTVNAEAFAGGRIVGLAVHSYTLDCEDDSYTYDSSWLVEPRVSVERWLTPWVSAGAQLGANALGERDSSFGLFLRGHVRAFDGTRSR
jgi:hypothetical protein